MLRRVDEQEIGEFANAQPTRKTLPVRELRDDGSLHQTRNRRDSLLRSRNAGAAAAKAPVLRLAARPRFQPNARADRIPSSERGRPARLRRGCPRFAAPAAITPPLVGASPPRVARPRDTSCEPEGPTPHDGSRAPRLPAAGRRIRPASTT